MSCRDRHILDFVRQSRNILHEVHLLDELLVMLLNFHQYCQVLFALNADVHSLKTVIIVLLVASHASRRYHNINLLLNFTTLSQNDCSTLALVAHLQYFVGWLTQLSVDYDFRLVEDCGLQEFPSICTHSQLSHMFDVWVASIVARDR